MKKTRWVLAGLLAAAAISMGPARAEPPTVTTPNISLHFDATGEISSCTLGPKMQAAALTGGSMLEGCSATGAVGVKRLPGGGLAVARKVQNPQHRVALLTDRFTPAKDSVRWVAEVVADGEPWTTPVVLQLKLPATARTALLDAVGQRESLG